MMVTELYLEVDDASKVTSVAAMDCGNSNAGYNADIEGNTITCTFLASTSKQGIPEVNDGSTTAVTADSALAVEFIITVKGNVTASINTEPMLKFSNFTAGKAEGVENTMNFGSSAANHATWTVNGEEGNEITFQGGSVEKDPIEIVGNRYDLADGFAWDVQVNKYQPAKTYTATFTDVTSSETKVNDFDFSQYVEAQENATFGFVALLKTGKTNVTLSVQ
jgi:hypothetical protein